ncbi:MAG TPA: GNAT family N-acetyltransferase [Marinobacterium sp.]|nr:GNAT family N-acetyltransferase [Marinobacterium sp.]
MFEIITHASIAAIGAERWNDMPKSDYPFMRYEFLAALESSGSVSGETGWQPLHVEVQKAGNTQLILPLYLKYHSWGEYVFDWSWAEAFQRAGKQYYPKLLCAIPFTPATGTRWLSRLESEESASLVAEILRKLCREYKVESAHLLFPQANASSLTAAGMMQRQGCQYHWFNQDFASFDDFLASFNARKRKDVRKERRKSVEQGISFEQLTGSDIKAAHMDAFYDFYVTTYLVRGQQPYLSKAFFHTLLEQMPEQLLLVMARQDNEYVAGALSFYDSSTLYGRYWGCTKEFDSLHFETCYYQGLEFCINNKLARFDPGAQGEHKIKRGFVPTPTHSYHYIDDQRFRVAISNFLEQEGAAVEQRILQLQNHLPFRQDDR